MAVTPYIDVTDPAELARFGLDARIATAARVLDATISAIAYMKRDLYAQEFTHTMEVGQGGYAALPMTPVVSLVSAFGMFVPVSNSERRSLRSRVERNQPDGYTPMDNLHVGLVDDLTILTGGVPTAQPIDISLISLNPRTGRIWIPSGAYLARYSEVEVTYTAGYAAIPDEVKMAVAKIIPNIVMRPSSNVMAVKEGNSEIKFSAAFIPDDVKMILDIYKQQWIA